MATQSHLPSVAIERGRTAIERSGALVCGGGAAGIAAAIALARHGIDVWLIESRANIGGTVTHALIHTLGGFFTAERELTNNGLAAELVETLRRADPTTRLRRMGRTWVLSAAPESYRDVVESLLAAEPRIQLLTGVVLKNVQHCDEEIVGVEGFADGEPFCIAPRAAIDASGSGELVKWINPAVIDNDPFQAACGLVVRLHGVAPEAVDFPNGLAVVRALHEAATNATIPSSCRHAWIDRGVRSGEVYVKLFVPRRPSEPHANASGQTPEDLQQTQDALVAYLRKLPGFNVARVNRIGELGIRDGGRVRGEYQLTGTDLRQGRRFDDVACRGCWPIEYWHPDRGLSLEYLPGNHTYDIPLRSLRVRGLSNVWVAGKCLSADHEAQASARVVGTCWAMGEAAGNAAAVHAMAHQPVECL